jgi:hypothetical protein
LSGTNPCNRDRKGDAEGEGGYAILYLADLPLARSLVWNIPTLGILMNIAGLLMK